jgi:UTP:GlnB (protein PII) uridylyltransferase
MSDQDTKKENFIRIEFAKEGNNFRLQLYFASDERGIVYRVTSVLHANEWNILGANIRSLENGKVQDEFLIHNAKGNSIDEKELDKLQSEMQQLFRDEISVATYMIKKGKKANQEKGNPEATITFEDVANKDFTKLRIRTKDRSGLLCDIARMLYLECLDILSVEANTRGSAVDDTFEIKSESGHSLDEGMQERLVRNLKSIL